MTKKRIIKRTLLISIIILIVIALINFLSKPLINNQTAAVETKKHIEQHPKEEIPPFPKASETAKKTDDQYSLVNNPDSLLVVVNKHRKLPDPYTPSDLKKPNVSFSNPKDKEKTLLRKPAADALETMFETAKKQGFELTAVSGFRSYKRQQSLHNTYVDRQGQESADTLSAVPGTSEHQTGLAMDISSSSANFQLEPVFGETPEGKWVAEHAHEFGFIIRYPKDKTNITEYAYEPWHLRFVGNPHATYLYTHHLTLEEAMEDNK